MTYKYCILVLAFILSLKLAGQDKVAVFTQEQLLWYVENYHPVAVRGNLLDGKGKATVRKARGAFDPYVYTDLDQKHFDDKNYFSILGSGLKVPTWYGVELKTGFEQNTGVFLNPENNTPSGGLWYGGISVPVGQGLFIDKRRATLKQARLFAESTRMEQQKQMNDLYFDAIKQYWEWVEAWNQYQVYEESLQLALNRFEAVRQSFFLGDKPAIDTLEAWVQVQNRQMNRNQFQLLYRNHTLELSNFLWFEDNTPLLITDRLSAPDMRNSPLADAVSSDVLQDLLAQLAATHPEMQLYRYKLASMDVERRLKKEGLKPKINLNFNALNEPVGSNIVNGLSAENYKWGIAFNFPLFLRRQRGDLQLTKLKIQDTELVQQQKLLELQNKVKSYYNEQLNLQGQVTLYTDAVNNYRRLFQGERKKFNTGESSLFLVNSREMSLIQSRLKLIELIAKYNITHTGLIWATGRLYDNE